MCRLALCLAFLVVFVLFDASVGDLIKLNRKDVEETYQPKNWTSTVSLMKGNRNGNVDEKNKNLKDDNKDKQVIRRGIITKTPTGYAYRYQPGSVVVENTIETKNFTVTASKHNISLHDNIETAAQKANVIDWFFETIGIRPTEPNPATEGPSKECPSCACGKSFKRHRIVGGVETVVNQYPWMTALMYNNRFYCGASLINNKYLLTAAHCVGGSKDKMSAVLLDHDRSNSFETKTLTRKIKNIFRHKNYGSGGNFNNDIALLQLDEEVPMVGKLIPVCLPQVGKSYTGSIGVAVGWGATAQHGQVSNRLREVEVPIMSNIDCMKTGYGSRISENMICAGYPDGKKDSCQGDSGGPLLVANETQHSVVGIVSWGEGCAQPNYPGVYTRVNRFISWIKSNTRDACYC